MREIVNWKKDGNGNGSKSKKQSENTAKSKGNVEINIDNDILKDVNDICKRMKLTADLNILKQEYQFNFESEARKILDKLIIKN